jgi:hypothetical protein
MKVLRVRIGPVEIEAPIAHQSDQRAIAASVIQEAGAVGKQQRYQCRSHARIVKIVLHHAGVQQSQPFRICLFQPMRSLGLNESAGSAPKVLDRVLREHNRRSKSFRNVTADIALHGKHSSGCSACTCCCFTYCPPEHSARWQDASRAGANPRCISFRESQWSCALQSRC